MHRLLPLGKPTRWWSPKLSPGWVQFWRPWRRLMQRRLEKIRTIEVRGLEHLKGCLDQGQGVLLTPNHYAYADPMVLFEAADQVGRPFYFMTAWQVFGTAGFLKRLVLRQHGCFSVDREGADLRAFRQAVEILQSSPHPLVIFPEGEMYHSGDRVTPFREGAAAIALAAAKRANRPISCLPCGLKFHYLNNPTRELLPLLDELERALHWRPRPDLTMPQRIYRIAEGALALKEIEFLGQTRAGPLPERIAHLSDAILRKVESAYGKSSADGSIPERVKWLRQQALKELESLPHEDPQRTRIDHDLDDVFFVVQLFCYPGDYVAQHPSIERIADTIDKFEEDILGAPLARIRGTRAAVLAFGEPVPIDANTGGKEAAAQLTRLLEQRVQTLLDNIWR